MKIVISFGGSIFVRNNFSILPKLTKFLKELQKEHKTAVVVGGGIYARHYINAGKQINLNNDDLDELAIHITRINALLLSKSLNLRNPIPYTESEASEILKNQNLIVMGGTRPGQSTDSVSSKLADLINADILINATDTEGVYDKDPKTHSDARLIPQLTYKEFRNLIKDLPQSPGNYPLFDLEAINIIEEAQIPLYIINGNNLNNINKAINNQNTGTYISSTKQ